MSEGRDKLLSLQFLRGIAAIFVVLCHTSFTHFGDSGVEFFLIISGFVMMYSTEKSASNYWAKRIIKIVPLYWLVTLVTAILVYIAPQLFRSYEVSLVYLVKSLCFIPYEHSGIEQPLLGLGWTLNYEMFFYLLFWIALKINQKRRGEVYILISTVLIVVNNIFRLPMPFSYWLDEILLEFSYGIVLFILYSKYREKVAEKANTYNVLFGTIIALLGISMMEFSQRAEISRAFSAGLIATVVIGIMLFMDNQMTFPNWIVGIGNVSYILYLTHIYPVRLLEVILPFAERNKWLTAIICICVAVISAMMWDKIVEQRVQKGLRKIFVNKNVK